MSTIYYSTVKDSAGYLIRAHQLKDSADNPITFKICFRQASMLRQVDSNEYSRFYVRSCGTGKDGQITESQKSEDYLRVPQTATVQMQGKNYPENTEAHMKGRFFFVQCFRFTYTLDPRYYR